MPRETVARSRQHTVYKVNGVRVPGVTTILGKIDKPAIRVWANKIGLEGIEIGKYTDGLADIGTLAHEMIHDILVEKVTPLDDWTPNQIDAAQNCAIKFLEWSDQHEIDVVEAEHQMVSKTYRYGGTADIIAWVDGVLGIIDIKTSKAIYDEMAWQVAAYRQLAVENGYEGIQEARIVQVGRSEGEGFSVKHLSNFNLEQGWDVFVAALGLYEAIRDFKDPENPGIATRKTT